MAEAAEFQGMAPSPARRWLRRAAALLAGTPLLAGLLYLPTAPVTHAADRASDADTVDVTLNSLSPSVPVKDDTLTISGTVTNKGKKTITDAEVDLRVGPRMSGRPDIDEASKATGYSPEADAKALGGPYSVKIDRLATGISEDFTLTVPVSKLKLDAAGVYQLGVSLSGQAAGEYDQVLGIERTFLPWQPESVDKRTQLTFLWPLISTTHLSAETGSDEQQTPVFENDALAAELAPGGRLEQLVSLGSQLPITWVIDPDLLATVDAMTRNYEVRTETGDTVPGRSQAVAKQWLSSLEQAVQDRQVVALPFADPDLASLAHRGKDVSGSLSHLQPATAVAETTVETVLHVKPSTDFAWPVEGAVDPSIVDVATSAGAHNIIARSDSLKETGSVSYTPSAARPIGGGTTAVVADARLSKAFYGDLSKAGTSTLAVQQFLAQSLALTHQAPDAQRSIVVAPQRMPTAGQAQTMAKALQGLAGQRWTQPLDLIAAAEAKPDPDATTRVPASSQYPKNLRARELPVQTFQDIKSTQETLDNFKIILTSPDRVVTPFGNAINREMSTSWRGRAGVAAQYRNGVQTYLEDLTTEVRLIQKSALTLSGRSATIPVTVQNKLVQGVDNLVLRLKSSNPTRLKLDDGSVIAEQPIKINGGHSQSVKFTAAANANGPVQVTAQLYTEDGKLYGGPMTFTVKASEITPTVMLVIAGGVLLLVLAGVRMYTQRKRAAAREAATAGEAADEAHGSAAADTPGQPSDPTPDTGPESADPSGAGEKVDR
ncbi:DUF6049 family protein [Streptomyces sp. WMMC940]|uniref:DUF6049 family protein n=1 Tax=Streptomyces sp. WMMC940 TaxID=3015153 RepID=UPI0022B6FBF4|nr:DUF6049 family protein [Streptomyces sp. WMMC940]MCZ7459243.1 DUF6049 family protein [Streptomyces sp. WMMC940]